MSKTRVEDLLFGPGAKVAFERALATDVGQAAEVHAPMGVVTSSTDDLAADTSETLTITNRLVQAESVVLAVPNGGGAGSPAIVGVDTKDGEFDVTVRNVDGSNACDAAYKVIFLVLGDQAYES